MSTPVPLRSDFDTIGLRMLARRSRDPDQTRVKDGAWYGWPNCYFDPTQKKLVLAPEDGGDGGKKTGICDKAEPPLAAFPAHWAPNDLKLYKGAQFPKSYVGGAFIAFHGSW